VLPQYEDMVSNIAFPALLGEMAIMLWLSDQGRQAAIAGRCSRIAGGWLSCVPGLGYRVGHLPCPPSNQRRRPLKNRHRQEDHEAHKGTDVPTPRTALTVRKSSFGG